MLERLKEEVLEANLEIVRRGLVLYTWGNASALDPDTKLMVIKPSGVDYDALRPEDMVVTDLEGKIIEGKLKPSSDAATHRVIYREFGGVGGVVHTHSTHATIWSQAGLDLPCYGTTHADYFYGTIPCTPAMTPEEIADEYEYNTGLVIIRRFREAGIDAQRVQAVLLNGHAPFTWGKSVHDAVHNAVVLEESARMALHARGLNPAIQPISQELLDKHYLRKHGAGAYYGQGKGC